MTTTISTDQDIATLINVFTVNPDNQQQLIDLLDEATTQVIRHRAGFISASPSRRRGSRATATTSRTCLPIPPPANI